MNEPKFTDDLIRCTVIERGDAETKTNQRTKAWYNSGTLNVALDTYEGAGTLEAYNAVLDKLPVMNMIKTYTGTWAIDHIRMETVANRGAEEERMEITAVIEHGVTGEVIFHCMSAPSYFFRDNLDGSITALYVD